MDVSICTANEQRRDGDSRILEGFHRSSSTDWDQAELWNE
jgi:hypothetical protein